MPTPGQELAALLVFDQEMASEDAACVEQWAHRIDEALQAERMRVLYAVREIAGLETALKVQEATIPDQQAN